VDQALNLINICIVFYKGKFDKYLYDFKILALFEKKNSTGNLKKNPKKNTFGVITNRITVILRILSRK